MGGGVPKCGENFLPFLCLKISVVCLVWSALVCSPPSLLYKLDYLITRQLKIRACMDAHLVACLHARIGEAEVAFSSYKDQQDIRKLFLPTQLCLLYVPTRTYAFPLLVFLLLNSGTGVSQLTAADYDCVHAAAAGIVFLCVYAILHARSSFSLLLISFSTLLNRKGSSLLSCQFLFIWEAKTGFFSRIHAFQKYRQRIFLQSHFEVHKGPK